MLNFKVLVIGSNSYLAKAFLKECDEIYKTLFVVKCLHNEIPENLNEFDCVINFSINPDYYNEKYCEDNDQDLLIVKKLLTKKPLYVMISSRLVYGESHNLSPFREDQVVDHIELTQYAKNKRLTEINCIENYPTDKLLIIRASNIIGLEFGRKTFMGIAQKSLKLNNQIFLDISGESKKDFLPVEVFSNYLLSLIFSRSTGIINVGSGIPIRVSSICKLMINGFGSGNIVFKERVRISGQFVLDISKLKTVINNPIQIDSMNNYFYSLGVRLKELR
jgi:nucleoside-diphosphate-sugar epimerase